MEKIKLFVLYAMIFMLDACGGGGGSPGGVVNKTSVTIDNTGGGNGGLNKTVPTMKISLVDGNKSTVSDHTLLRGISFYLRATLLDANGSPIPYTLVKFTADASTASLVSPSTLTDKDGIAEVAIKSASLKAVAGNVSATATVATQSISDSMDIQTKSAVIILRDLSFPTLTPPLSLAANQTREVLAKILVDGNPAPASLLNAKFETTCGAFSADSVATNSSGEVRTNYTVGTNCDQATITASIVEVVDQTKTISLAVNKATSSRIDFMNATTPTMVTSRIPGALSNSTLTFKLFDSSNTPIKGKALTATLAQESLSVGIRFEGDQTTLSTTTDGDGLAKVVVKAGGVPGPVTVQVVDPDNTNVLGISTGLKVSSGKAAQDRISLSSDKSSLEAFAVDNVTASLTLSVSDRFGNPVPAGTAVNFATNSGLVVGSSSGTCLLDSTSQCSVTYRSINGSSRPKNGHVFVLAWMNGEEAFVDINGDGIWQRGETFYPLGTPYLDNDWNGSRGNTEQIVGNINSAPGTSACASSAYPSVVNTCDTSIWRDDVTVRAYYYLTMATKDARITQLGERSSGGFWVWISDANTDSTLAFSNTQIASTSGFRQIATSNSETIADLLNDAGYLTPLPTLYKNSMPSGSLISAQVETSGAKCTVKGTSLDKVPTNTTDGILVYVRLGSQDDCLTVGVSVTVKSPAGQSTTVTF
jgi:hypothetical protein